MRSYFKYVPLVSFVLFIFTACSWAMDEDEYARMAADALRIIHEAKGDSQVLRKAAEEFVKKFSDEKKQEQEEMARKVMNDPKLARRISEKIVDLLTRMGYKVKIPDGAGLEGIIFEDEKNLR